MANWFAARCYLFKIPTSLMAGYHGARARPGLATFCSSGTTPVPKVAAKQPFEVNLVAGKKYSWCSCGLSKKQPFCDGSGRKTDLQFAPLRFFVEESKTVLLCGCKQTKTPPYCDGTHKEEFAQHAMLERN